MHAAELSSNMLLSMWCFAQNVDSEKSVTVDGQELKHGQELKLKVGAKIDLGGEIEYQVDAALHNLVLDSKCTILFLTANALMLVAAAQLYVCLVTSSSRASCSKCLV